MLPSTRSKTQIPWIPVTIGVVLVAVFIWPTAWSTSVIGGNTWRFQRFSGCSEVQTPAGWKPVGPARCDAKGDAEQARKMAQAAQAQTAEDQALAATWQPVDMTTNSELNSVIDKLRARMRVTRAWADVEDNVPLFHVEVQNDSACAVDTIMLSVTDPVYGEVLGVMPDTPPNADPHFDPPLPAGAHVSANGIPEKVEDHPLEEIPVSRLKVSWDSVLPVIGQPHGCEDRAAGI